MLEACVRSLLTASARCYNPSQLKRLRAVTMVLSDRTIKEELAKGRIVVDPLGEGCIQPASIDLRLGRQILTFQSKYERSLDDLLSDTRPGLPEVLDVRDDLSKFTVPEEMNDRDPFILDPGQFILASTLETVELPDDVVARLEGKSSLGRLGLLVHATAGYVDPGFKGQLTLEISNALATRITLFYAMKISQISFLRLSTAAENPYGSRSLRSKYQGQTGPVPSREHMNFTGSRAYAEEPTELKVWLDQSQYAGNVAKLAKILESDLKTVQDWVYGRNEPNSRNKIKLFEITRLPSFAPEPGASQPRLLPSDQSQLHMAAPDQEV